MEHEHASIWRQLPADLVLRTEHCIAAACRQLKGRGYGYIFFRADDVAVPSPKFARLLEIFKHNRVPLCLAVVPACLTARRWQYLKDLGAKESSLWCWHQHGWRHVNHEINGKKQEFGASRNQSDIKRDLVQGKRGLEDLMEAEFYPVFTPPWNRCSLSTLQLLRELGYVAVSRYRESMPQAPRGLPDFSANVDLHTRKERNPEAGWINLFEELRQAISSGCCGIMIHHQRMNDAAFDYLEILLKALVKHRELEPVHFKDLNLLGGEKAAFEIR